MNNDLISRSALKKALHNFFDGKVIDEPTYILRDVLCHIDSAPTVEPFERIGSICEENCGYRPQGEWIKIKEERMSVDMSSEIVTQYKCSKCGRVIATFPSKLADYYPFCQRCGADMRNITETPSSCTTTNPNSVEAYHQSLKGGAE